MGRRYPLHMANQRRGEYKLILVFLSWVTRKVTFVLNVLNLHSENIYIKHL